MALAANDILKVVVSLAFPDSVVAQNIFWTLFEADGSSVDDDDVLDDLETYVEAIYANILGALSDLVSLDDMKVYVYDSVGADFDEVGDRTVTGVGTLATHMLPHGVAAVSNIGTTDPDVQGRKFWGGLGEDASEDGYVSAPSAAAFALCVGDWMTPFTGANTGSGFIPGVWSVVNTLFYASNAEGSTNLLLGYQRRRKPGVGI